MIFRRKKGVSEKEKRRILGDRYDTEKDHIDWNHYAFKQALKKKKKK